MRDAIAIVGVVVGLGLAIWLAIVIRNKRRRARRAALHAENRTAPTLTQYGDAIFKDGQWCNRKLPPR